jgi:hypothetical protein
MPHSILLDNERIATSTPESQAGVLVVRRHHPLVRYSHWLNVPIEQIERWRASQLNRLQSDAVARGSV